MKFRIPGFTSQARIMERVKTADEQYFIFDAGLEHADGSIDSIAVGGSFATARRVIEKMNAEADEAAETAKVQTQIEADVHAAENNLPVINVDGTEVPKEEQRVAVTVS